MRVDDINESSLSQHLETRGMPDPDILVRTSGASASPRRFVCNQFYMTISHVLVRCDSPALRR